MDTLGIDEDLKAFFTAGTTLLGRVPEPDAGDPPDDPMVGIFRHALHTSMAATSAMMAARGSKRKLCNDGAESPTGKRVKVDAVAAQDAAAASVPLPHRSTC